MTACFSLPDCFSACKTTQELPVTQLARHVDLFHLVVTDNQRPDSLPPPWLGPSYKAHYSFQPICCSLTWGRGQPCGLDLNKSFLSTCGMVLIWQYLTSGAEGDAPVWGCSLGLHVLPSPEPRLQN
jgi:hypothetical protein